MKTGNYTTPVPDYGDLFTVKEFKEMMDDGTFYNDGYGHPVKNEKMDLSIEICPPGTTEWPEDATHIMWFNK